MLNRITLKAALANWYRYDDFDLLFDDGRCVTAHLEHRNAIRTTVHNWNERCVASEGATMFLTPEMMATEVILKPIPQHTIDG